MQTLPAASKRLVLRTLGAAMTAAVVVGTAACGSSEPPPARSAASPRVSQTRTTSATVAAPRPARDHADAQAKHARERAQLVALAAECERESGGTHSKAERAKKHAEEAAQRSGAEPVAAGEREPKPSEADMLDKACEAAALACASFDAEKSASRDDQ